MAEAQPAVEAVFRREWGRIMAALIRISGSFDLAEEAAQEAFVAALAAWPERGIPENPAAWIMAAAHRKLIDAVRREHTRRAKEDSLRYETPTAEPPPAEIADSSMDFPDDRLRLIFTCCHPALNQEAQVALTLRTLGGLSTPEIAKAFLVPEATLAQRLVRARRKIQQARIPYEVPSADRLPERLSAVQAVVYLIFNEGYLASSGSGLLRDDLCAEAIRLGRVLCELLPRDAESIGLLALMLLHDSRRHARTRGGVLVTLEEQDRSLWDRDAISEGLTLLDRALALGWPGPYQLQAAIAALHAQAPAAEATDWRQIAALYERLLALSPSPVITLNHAVAVAMSAGLAEGLKRMDDLGASGALDGYYLFHAARADLLRRLGRFGEAAEAYRRAAALATNPIERDFLERRLSQSRPPSNQADLAQLAAAVRAGDVAEARILLGTNPRLIGMDMSGNDEHRVLHYAVLRRDAPMVKLLMEAGADARQGIYPHRAATTAFAIARDREYHEIAAIIEEEEHRRRAQMSCPNATISPAQDEIVRAIRKGDAAAAMVLLEADSSLIHACDREGGTPLHAAAEATNEALVAWLLARHANVTKRDIHGFTALDRAALAADPRNQHAARFPAIARLLLEQGAEVTIRAAVALDDGDRVRDLLRDNPGALHEIASDGGLLTLAVNHGHLEMVRLLLDLGADVDERITLSELEEPTPSWGMPLWYAALANRRDIVELLLDRGADPNANVYASGWPLRNAWNHEDPGVKLLLLERGAKPQPYMLAEAHDVAGARRLLDADAGEELARELAWSAADHGCPEILELALPRLPWPAADPRWHWVIIQPIRGAGHEGHFGSMNVLLRHGVDPNVSCFGQTVLHFAAGWHGSVSGPDRARFAAMLLDHGARLDLRDELLQSTPLGWACRWGRTELAEFLIARGAPVDEPDAEPWATPIAWAEKMGHQALVARLRSTRPLA